MTPSWRATWLVTLSAVLYFLAFPEWNVSVLAWVALTPWLIAQDQGLSWKGLMLRTAWMSVIIGAAGFHWICYALHEFGNLPIPVCILGLILFSLGGQPQFYIYGAFRKIMTERYGLKSGVPRLLILALAYAAIDWIVPKLFMDTLGHAFLGLPRMRQGASIGGAYLLTFCAVLVNEALASLWRDRRRAWREMAVAAAVGLALLVFGHFRLAELKRWAAAPPSQVRVGVIQANIGDIDKIAAHTGDQEAANQVVDTYLSLSEEALARNPRPDFLIWPETAYPSLFRHPLGYGELEREHNIDRLVIDHQTALLFGGYDIVGRKDFNTLFMLTPSGLQIYHKNVLLPFGEYIPIVGQMQWVEHLFPQVGNFGHGPGPQAIPIPIPGRDGIIVGPVICYEALFPEYTRGGAALGNQLILNITNDSWFGPHTEPQLHLALTVFRSLETGLPQIRSTNTGISAVILPDGEISQSSRVGEKAALDWVIPLEAPGARATVYMRYGDEWLRVAWFLILVFIGGMEWKRRGSAKKS